jgi:hypothetical protein
MALIGRGARGYQLVAGPGGAKHRRPRQQANRYPGFIPGQTIAPAMSGENLKKK